MYFRTLSKIAFPLLFLSLLAGCGKKEADASDSKQQLVKLKAEKASIEAKIKALEGISGASSKAENGKVPVSVYQVSNGLFQRYVDIQGTVESQGAAVISADMPGRVTVIHVQTGASVAKGALLLEIDDAVLQNSLEELNNAYEFANTVFEKQKRLWDQKAGSEIQYLQAKNTKESLEKKLKTVKQQMKSAKIYAPFAGVIDEVVPKLGEMVSPGFPVIRITNMSNVKIKANVSEAYSATIKQGNPVIINFPELNTKVDARISVVTKSIDASKRTFAVEVKLPTIPQGCRPNMLCGVSFNDVTIKDALTVPLSAIQREGDKQFVFVAVNNKAQKKYITTGLSYKDRTVINGGLASGEQVITNGAFDVADGQDIIIK